MSTRHSRGSIFELVVIVGLLATVSGLNAMQDSPSGPQVGVERHSVDCAPGEPRTIEVAPITRRVELAFGLSCHCFGTAEEAAAWLQGEVEAAMAGGGDALIRSGGLLDRVVEPAPGDPVEVVVYCLTEEQVDTYLDSLTSTQEPSAEE